MISFDLAYELTLGAMCAALQADPRAPIRLAEPSLRGGLWVSGAVYVPSAMAAVAIAPFWQTMYLVDFPPTVATLLLVGAVQTVGLIAAYFAGFWLCLRARAAGWARALSVGLGATWVALLIGVFGVLWHRAFTVTSYAGFHAPGRVFQVAWGAPENLLGSTLLYVLVVAGVVNVAVNAFLFYKLRPRKDEPAVPAPQVPATHF